MKKTLLLATVATVAFTMSANAIEFKPYVAAKATLSDQTIKAKMNIPAYQGRMPAFYQNLLTPSYDFDKHLWGQSIAAGVSYNIGGNALRTEIEFNRVAKAKVNNVVNFLGYALNAGTFTLKNQSYMLNAYYDFDTGSKFTPYIGAGIGYARLKGDFKQVLEGEIYLGRSVRKNNLALQAGLGISYAMNDNLSLDLGYRYINYGTFTKTDDFGAFMGAPYPLLRKTSVDTAANEVYFGVRYSF